MSGSALVVVDLQRWIVDSPWAPISGTSVVAACERLQSDFARSHVVLVRHLRSGEIDAVENRLVPEQHERHVVIKNELDAFAGTELDDHLRGLGVARVVIAGLATTHGVRATAESAVALGYDVAVVSDATAAVTVDEHEDALQLLAARGARVTTVDELLLG
ncbi:cysteine hydrolase family protein [Antrihabitans cavernicola]|uniref:cysteine hydrolase family protein n=1 Tax=Antrihabitans cavernicola TaxID=2495913 RepID=UPI001659EDB2|nr:cysteine hydrolase [Spelaeibacter cavernicola]